MRSTATEATMFPASKHTSIAVSSSTSEVRVFYVQNSYEQSEQQKHCRVTFARPLVNGVHEVVSGSATSQQHFVFPDNFSVSPILSSSGNLNASVGPALCRICYSSEESGPKHGEPLISPCHCKGTMGLYHRTCLGKWLSSSNKDYCEICRFKFQIKRVPRSFCEYIRDADSESMRRSLWTDMLCFLFLTPLVFLTAFVCSFSAWHLTDNDEDGPKVEVAIGLVCLSVLLIIAYFVWFGVTMIFHRNCFRSWQKRHWKFTIVDQLSLEESIIVNGSDRRIV